MKAETKEIIKGICHVLEYSVQDDQCFLIQAIDFLDSIPEIEEQLKHGGFIPDRNKKPCKDGDKIRLIYKTNNNGELFLEGFLRWDSKKYCFFASEYEDLDIRRFDISADGVIEFERIDGGVKS